MSITPSISLVTLDADTDGTIATASDIIATTGMLISELTGPDIMPYCAVATFFSSPNALSMLTIITLSKKLDSGISMATAAMGRET